MRHYAQDLRALANSIDAAADQKERLARAAADQRARRKAHKKRVETVAAMMMEGMCDWHIAQAIERREADLAPFKKEALAHLRRMGRVERNRQIVQAWKAGASDPEIAERFEMHPKSVNRLLSRYRLSIQSPATAATSGTAATEKKAARFVAASPGGSGALTWPKPKSKIVPADGATGLRGAGGMPSRMMMPAGPGISGTAPTATGSPKPD